jgi:mycofactocin precursor
MIMTVTEQRIKDQELEVKGTKEENVEVPSILEEVTIEELAVDGICGIY